MKIRETLQRQITSAAAALAVSTFFIGAAMAPVAVEGTNLPVVQQSVA